MRRSLIALVPVLVLGRDRRGSRGGDDCACVTGLPDFETTIVNGQLAISLGRR